MTAPPDDNAADLYGVIAVLRSERDALLVQKTALVEELAARTAELLERKTEFGEQIAQQAATIDVLKVMSTSPGDPQPVFDLIVERARTCCGAELAALTLLDGDLLRLNATSGMTAARNQEFARAYPLPVSQAFAGGRAILTRDTVQVPDTQVDPGFAQRGTGAWHRSVLAVPLLRAGLPIGAIGLGRATPGTFSTAQVELLKIFAEQAVIAIGSAETFRALQERTHDLQESLEYQTATSDVLQTISRAAYDLDSVLTTLLVTAERLCDANHGQIWRKDGEVFRYAASHMNVPAYREKEEETEIRAGRGTLVGRVALEGRPVLIADAWHDAEYADQKGARLAEARSMLGVPLLRDGELIGAFALARRIPVPFTDRQVDLVRTFADQAVIAMENARLITEQREALEQQTATAEVLQVINASPGDLAPVFEVILEKAHRLCGVTHGSLELCDGETFRAVATLGFSDDFADILRRGYPGRDSPDTRSLIDGARFSHILDLAEMNDEMTRSALDLDGHRTLLCVPLRRDGQLLGMIASARKEVRAFTDKEVALLESFAAQAVIAMENARLINEQREALEQQTATAEVLGVINASPGNLAPVFDAMLEKAHKLCGVTMGALLTYDGHVTTAQATRGYSEQLDALVRQPRPLHLSELVQGDRFLHIPDMAKPEFMRGDFVPMFVEQSGARTYLAVALRKDGRLIGMISAIRTEVRPFSDKEITLLENFAAQAVIAMENARLITEQREALEQQTATAEVLQVINASPGDLRPVFDAMMEKAMRLCEAAFGALALFDSDTYRIVATHNLPEPLVNTMSGTQPIRPGSAFGRVMQGESIIHIADASADEVGRAASPVRRAMVDVGGTRTALWVALHKDGVPVGCFMAYRREVRPFSDRQVALLENFAAQAVIAMENGRLLDELRQRQEELRITFENMGDGVAMFDETQHLVAWNRKFQEILDVPDDIIARRQTFTEYVHYLAARGEYGRETDPEEHVRGLIEQAGQSRTYERTRPDGRVIEIRHNPVAGGSFVLIYADITERKRNEAEIRAARDAAEEASRTIEAAYRELKTAQANLIQAEKMASLGQLTAGIAHEIKNPLNFVNNFAALSVDLLSELKETAAPGFATLSSHQRAEIDDVSAMLTSNLQKITEHGKRADGIVKAMLEHSRGSSGERHTVDLNALIDEALNLAYHGARAQDQSFNITLERDFGEGIAPIEVNPQDMTRVLLNIFANGFYATARRARSDGNTGFVPTLKVTTRNASDAMEIRVRDNGTGIPADIRDKLFQPFFTTKPTGEGTGLGLSITYDIVTKAHGGSIAVDSEVGEYSEFAIRLPRKP